MLQQRGGEGEFGKGIWARELDGHGAEGKGMLWPGNREELHLQEQTEETEVLIEKLETCIAFYGSACLLAAWVLLTIVAALSQ